MSLLEVRGRLHYPSGFIVDVAFETDDRITALSGPSGSGKTTVLSMIAGLRKPDEGFVRRGDAVLFDSQAGINMPPEARHIGYVFQQHLLFPHLTVRDNLLYGWKRQRSRTRHIEPERIIGVLDLAELVDRKPATLSGGQRQRIALGRALLSAPELLLLDEPLASIDAELKGQVLDYIEKVLGEWEIPTLYVTHDLAEISRICQRVVRLDRGRVVVAPLREAR